MLLTIVKKLFKFLSYQKNDKNTEMSCVVISALFVTIAITSLQDHRDWCISSCTSNSDIFTSVINIPYSFFKEVYRHIPDIHAWCVSFLIYPSRETFDSLLEPFCLYSAVVYGVKKKWLLKKKLLSRFCH